jgi:hypothetical protein
MKDFEYFANGGEAKQRDTRPVADRHEQVSAREVDEAAAL